MMMLLNAIIIICVLLLSKFITLLNAIFIICGLLVWKFITVTSYVCEVQTEECLKLGGNDVDEVDRLPQRERSEFLASDYDSSMLQLKEMAPRNGRAVFLFRNNLFGPFVSKLEAWN